MRIIFLINFDFLKKKFIKLNNIQQNKKHYLNFIYFKIKIIFKKFK